jgi:ATP-dependent Clp protease ATP-binding subunit ClpC
MHLLDSEKMGNLEVSMKERVIGQDHAISQIAKILRASYLFPPSFKRPIGVFLFVGPTGVGKTELSKTLAEILYGDENRLIQLNLSEFYNRRLISRLIASTDAHCGIGQEGQLTGPVRMHPNSVVLLDTIEKAHPDVLRLLMEIIAEGYLTDGLGRPVDFRNTVVIMTSNIGSDRIRAYRPEGEDLRSREEQEMGVSIRDIRGDIKKDLGSKLSPEFVSRLSGVIIFNLLNKENLRNIATLMLSKIPIKVEADEKVLDFLVNARYDPDLGARTLRRTLDDYVVNPLADKIVGGHMSKEDEIKLGMSGSRITFEITGKTKDNKGKSMKGSE